MLATATADMFVQSLLKVPSYIRQSQSLEHKFSGHDS